MATIGLGFQLSANAARMSGGVNEAVKQLQRIGNAVERTASSVGLLKTLAVGSVVAKGISSVAGVFSSAGSAALSYVSGIAAASDQTDDLAQRIGMSVESLQALKMAAKLAGVDDVSGALQKLSMAIGKASESGDAKAFTNLGIEFSKLEAMDPGQQFETIQKAIAALPTSTQRAAAAVDIFGKSGVEMLPLMEQNLGEIEAKMRSLGAIVGKDQVSAIGDMNDAFDTLKATLDGIAGQVLGNLADIVTAMTNDLLGFVAAVKGFDAAGNEVTGGTAIADTITNTLLAAAKPFLETMRDIAKGLVTFVDTMLKVGARLAEMLGIDTRSESRRKLDDMQVRVNAGTAPQVVEAGGFSSRLDPAFASEMASLRAVVDQEEQAAESFAKGIGQAIDNAFASAIGAVDKAQAKMTPEARAERDAARRAKEAEEQAARDAAAAAAEAARLAAAQKKREEKAAKVAEKFSEKEAELYAMSDERADALRGKSNESLKANDIRSSEGMAQFIALATGREDPAIEEYRKQTKKLDEIRAELRALQLEQVTILNGAGA